MGKLRFTLAPPVHLVGQKSDSKMTERSNSCLSRVRAAEHSLRELLPGYSGQKFQQVPIIIRNVSNMVIQNGSITISSNHMIDPITEGERGGKGVDLIYDFPQLRPYTQGAEEITILVQISTIVPRSIQRPCSLRSMRKECKFPIAKLLSTHLCRYQRRFLVFRYWRGIRPVESRWLPCSSKFCYAVCLFGVCYSIFSVVADVFFGRNGTRRCMVAL